MCFSNRPRWLPTRTVKTNCPLSPGFRTSGFTLATVQPQDGWGLLSFSSAAPTF